MGTHEASAYLFEGSVVLACMLKYVRGFETTSKNIVEFHLSALRGLRVFFLIDNTTKGLALASPATQSGEESKPRNTLNTRKKVVSPKLFGL